ncbi:MAG: zinc-binding dehydrogenase [Caldilineaceae bacterium SB0670_bin_27]|uniref:Zinc-binding dehydrogenase n=1 Tax=Caldilineaceae bacterium SB0664_bin_27 TaxID=2605260 RepID=A0A6B0YX35_9CHLR|nr:zinc-binding dehydrogenase [Caldilineaceae bacterium SB0664_bin_27]MYJ79816.1 zinc-binding dehydrogenase [Caldilineaceae bacterium SB0670_bin_27]
MIKIKAVETVGPRQVTVVEDELAEPGAGQVAMRSLYSGISHGTEMNVYRGDAPMWQRKQDRRRRLFVESDEPEWEYPLRYGYACVGVITAVGRDVTEFAEGDVVFSFAPHQSAHVLPARSVSKLPEGIDPRAGVLTAVLNTTFNGILDADLHLGECVVVFGQGVLGQLTVQWAKLSGASPVIAVDLIEKRLEISKRVSGADLVFNAGEEKDIAMAVRELTDDRGADVVFEFSASDRALNEAIRTACYNGKVIVMSWYAGALANVYPGAEFHHNRIQLISSQISGISPELSHRWSAARRMQAVLSLMPKLNLEGLITDVVDLEGAAAAYEMIDKHPEDVLQVVLDYGED